MDIPFDVAAAVRHLRQVSDARSRDDMGRRDATLDKIADWLECALAAQREG